MNGFDNCMYAVSDSKPDPTRNWEPLARLMNYIVTVVNIRVAVKPDDVLTVVFPAPVGPITLREALW